MGGALLWAVLMTLGIDGVRNLDLELVLDAAAHDLRDEGASGVALRELSQLGDATLGGGMVNFRFGGSASNRVTDRSTHG